MSTFVMNQTYVFFIFIICGSLIALLFDIFRIFRKSFKTPDLITYIEDILFWLLTCIILAYTIFKYNNGELRAYIFIGLFIGFTIYLLYISRFVISISVKVINKIKIVVLKILNLVLYPFKAVIKLAKKLLLTPILIVFINIRKKLSINLRKSIKMLKKNSNMRRI